MSSVLLIAPPWGQVYGNYRSLSRRMNFHPPLGLCYLASSLAAAGHRVKVVDAEAEGLDEDVLAALARQEWDVIGFTATTPVFPAAVALAEKMRAHFHGTMVLGGPHATIVREEAFAGSGCLDYLVCGEGEHTIVRLVETLADGGDTRTIPGIVMHDGKGFYFSGPADRQRDLDHLPFPDRSHLNPDNYLWSVPGRGIVPTTSVIFSRGCPFECTFCSQRFMYGREVTRRSVDNMLAEFEVILSETPYRHFVFLDDTLTSSRSIVSALFQGIIDRGYRITFEGETRANLLDTELVKLMKRAGLVRMNIGIESGDPEMLKRLKTGVTLDDVRQTLRLLKSFGVETRGTVVIGAPYERRETAMRTLEYLTDLKDLDQPYICIAAPYPGTLMREQALRGEGGARLLQDDYGSLKRYGSAAMEVNDLSAADLVELQSWGLRRTYLRPKRLIYNLGRAGLRAGVRNGFAFVRSMLSSALKPHAGGN